MGKLIAVAFLLFASLPLHAESVLTWEQSVDRARKNNPDLIAAEKSVEARRAKKNETYNRLFPRLNLTSSYNESMNSDGNSAWGAGASANMDLFDQSSLAAIKSASASLDQAEASRQSISSGLLFDLRQAFANLLFTQNQIDVSKRIQEIRQRNAELVQLRYSSGRESKGNMLRAQADKLQADVSVSQSFRDLKAAQRELNRQLGEDNFSTITATGPVFYAALAPEPLMEKTLIENHPSVLIQKANVELARADVQNSKSSLWPALSANYNRSFVGPDYFPERPNWTASAVLSYPLFGGGPTAAYYSIKGSKRNLEGAEQDLRATINQIESELNSAWAGWASALDQVQVQKAFLEAARQRNDEADVRYANGLLSYENWEIIVSDRVNSERSLIRVERDAVVAEAQWSRASGIELGEIQ